ncbi:hypothetical protein EBME_2394 [bacterium endosymbiont of Mortierella elongata FMR23-6]|nr:hypothetical protein EBME_2394 [bacterium endosymbiont of Mortierella elongata FMR23-6]
MSTWRLNHATLISLCQTIKKLAQFKAHSNWDGSVTGVWTDVVMFTELYRAG